MDLTEVLTKLTATSGDLALRSNEVTTLTARNADLTTQVTTLTARITELEAGAPALTAAQTQVTTLQGEKTTLQASLTEATTALKDIHKKVLTASGKPDAVAPEGLTELVAEITEKSAALTLALGKSGSAAGAEAGSNKTSARTPSAAFRVR